MSPSVLLVVGHSTGGIGAHVASLARGLAGHGWEATVVTSRGTGDRFDFGSARLEVGWPGRRPGDALRRLRSLRRLAAAADVVHAHGHQAGLLAVLLAATVPRRRRPPVVVSWHNAVLSGGSGRHLRGVLERFQAVRSDLLTGASQDLVERAASLGAHDARLAPVAAPLAGSWRGDRPAAREVLARELDLPLRGSLVLTVSRLAPQKLLPVLVEAAALLRDREHLVWLVAGEGDPDLLRRLEAQVVASGAPVRFVGARGDVAMLMGLADVFVLASAWEARALVVQEAMAAGLPVVTTAVGGLPELVGEAGVLVPPGDAAALAAAVAAVLDDDAERERLGVAGRARFAQLPSEDDVVEDWAARYRDLLRSPW